MSQLATRSQSDETDDPIILIVDDDDAIRALLLLVLSRSRFNTLQAADAETAVGLLAANRVAVALCDQAMPGLGGEWLVDHIREHYPSVAIIIATGCDVPPRVSNQRGVVGHLQKPFTRETVVQAVSDAVAWHKVAARRTPPKS